MLNEELLALDRDLIWHPYSQHGLGQAPIPVRRAHGAYLELSDGRKVIDGISSWWVNVHGHGHPLIQEAISKQAQDLDHVLFAGFTHEPAVELARKLLLLTRGAGADLSRVFFSDNGSTAVEVALKMAFQFHQNRGDRVRTRFIALHGSYHGDTLGAMSVNEPEGYHRVFRPLLPSVDFVKPVDLASLE
jgi:adenosylmethionine-8-amino-7-oxononanoate aminotransferase